jgi:hypothetical protein
MQLQDGPYVILLQRFDWNGIEIFEDYDPAQEKSKLLLKLPKLIEDGGTSLATMMLRRCRNSQY